MIKNEKLLGYLLMAFSVILFIVLGFIKTQFDVESALLCQKFHENKIDLSQCPVHQADSSWNKISWVIVVGFGLGILIFGVGAYLAFFYKTGSKELKKEFKQINFSHLDDEEKRIYEIVKSSNGSAYQTDLIKETGFSKVKITRILDKLEAKDILERKRRGMTNIIVLK
jgi:uncharacterized membrane protein